jgi:hypothetical protein
MPKWTHALAGALVAGWFLMQMPVYQQPPYFATHLKQLGEWSITGVFDDAKDCQAAAAEVQRKGQTFALNSLVLAQILSDRSAQCVSTQDPRLKEQN